MLTHSVNLVSDQHLDHVLFSGESVQLIEPGVQAGEGRLTTHVVHWRENNRYLLEIRHLLSQTFVKIILAS